MPGILESREISSLLRRVVGKKRYTLFLGLLLLLGIVAGKESGFTVDDIFSPHQLSGTDETKEVRVVRVVDGDTFEIEGGERVRLIGVDTPETVQPNAPVECFGKQASDFLKAEIEGKIVRLERDMTDRDRYARLLRYAYLDDVFLNERMVREGYAESKAYKPDTARQALLDRAEELARSEKLGQWDPTICPR